MVFVVEWSWSGIDNVIIAGTLSAICATMVTIVPQSWRLTCSWSIAAKNVYSGELQSEQNLTELTIGVSEELKFQKEMYVLLHRKWFLKSCSSQLFNRNFICLYNLANAACSTAKACCWVLQDLQNHNPPIINLNCRANMAIWCERGISFYIRKSSSALPADKNSLHLSTIVPAWGSQCNGVNQPQDLLRVTNLSLSQVFI